MTTGVILLSISLTWIISEFALAIAKRSKIKAGNDLDKRFLTILWMTIITCVPLGIFLGVRGVGRIYVENHFLSAAGVVLIALGLVLRWTAILTLKKYFMVNVSVLSNHQLIIRGIYKAIRHPAYAGSLLSFFGLGLTFVNWLSILVIFVPMLAAFVYRIRLEERTLTRHFGEKYIHYCATAKRLIPKIY